MQWLDTGKIGIFVTLLMVAFILFNIARARKGKKELFIRRIPGLNAIDDAIGRATEMGRPIFMVPGIGTLNAISVQAVNIFAQVTKTASQFATPIRMCIADAAVYTVAQEVIRDVYQRQGMLERFDVDSVRFISDRQFAFAAGVSGLLHREKAAATFLLGEFYAESLIFAETANSIGAIQVAGSTQTSQTPFFVAACDYVLLGDEFYAASAYLTREPVLVGSLVGQDWCKIMITAAVFLGALFHGVERSQVAAFEWAPYAEANEAAFSALSDDAKEKVADVQVQVPSSAERQGIQALKKGNETMLYRIFNPNPSAEDLVIEREKKPPPPAAEGEEGGE
ncbi:MAG: hypothetical protein IT207_03660 [Fimbriimonadaceae bacterium]|nr:hypothetical protein [Fimbriimonadaceae bacterium]